MNYLDPNRNFTRKRRSNTDLKSEVPKIPRLEDEGQDFLSRGVEGAPTKHPVNTTRTDAKTEESSDEVENLEELLRKFKITRDEKIKRWEANGLCKPIRKRARCSQCEKSAPEKGGVCRYCGLREKEELENGPSGITIRSVEGLLDL
ncbi:hypothetical protein FOXG_21653 [Fusarium oxysporum f. sp. lycopersici 4287]|uniref:Uncharacterized protein n=1 Tax=Fusarium oxysporum f. sp. lycopersici (strain 4287 / CBS 123668 / FGSC 9935 / NRRL 34936) TaxID=426428 RepID=A0A0J9W0Q0_FUSO4|nr:hypothetical protein FOXG_21653 [Fusarium oxysporum f. sp. lycopersici 4287]KAJ9414882.1 hypothetical protein QL093DRAFT_2105424 [Fusarium oxysporum]KNB16380.1 hypothetical protein FOXG_21653 [Fusarium oxysporum f. sp. lycopersici 4287]